MLRIRRMLRYWYLRAIGYKEHHKRYLGLRCGYLHCLNRGGFDGPAEEYDVETVVIPLGRR